MPNDDMPVTFPQVRINAQPIAGYLDYIRWLATDETARRTTITADQLWAFYEDHIRSGVAPRDAAKELGLPVSPDW